MKNFIVRLSLAAAVTLGVIALGSSANAQEPNAQDPAATTPPQQQSPASTQQDQQQTPQEPAASTDSQTQDAKAFTGRIMRENGKVVLKDPLTKTSYQIDDASKAKQFMGKQVKVTGKLDMNSNTIHVDSIEPLS